MLGDANNEKRKRLLWNDEELLACVHAYRTALIEIAQLGTYLNQSQLNEAKNGILKRRERVAVAEFVEGRPEATYEPRMQNITHLLSGLGLETISKYPPLSNVGPTITSRLLRIINAVWMREGTPEQPTGDANGFQTRVRSAVLKVNPASPPPKSPFSGQRIETATKRFLRDPNVVAWVLVTAKGHCEACSDPAPFVRDDGEPYLEVHHVRPLAEGGPDSADNAIAVCPTCHRRFHHGSDKKGFRRKTIRKVSRLVDYPVN